MALEHMDVNTDLDAVLFVIHSACFEQPAVVVEVCSAMLKLDVQLASHLLLTRDAPLACLSAGLCYAEQDGVSA